ncbi:elongator complex protein 5 isoform X1 [Hypanus sabinus]|uniref:elongator complex protein 5 isoform X1 n=1 Tax=Hypanus sabinus TaxID=79690 RepID=UPI0028C44BE8|nr:elongator complex protein 5 isoform X1 [Hypanus sabinus]
MLSGLSGGSGPEGLVVVTDSLKCEGRSLIKSLVKSAAVRGECIHVATLELSMSEFCEGLDESVRARLRFEDGFSDPLHWEQSDALPLERFTGPEMVSRLEMDLGSAGTRWMLVLDSLSQLLQARGATTLCRDLHTFQRRAASAGLGTGRVLGLLHADLHQPQELEVVAQMANAVVSLTPVPQGHQCCREFPAHAIATCFHRRKSGKVHRTVEYFTVEDGLGLRTAGVPFPEEMPTETSVKTDPTADLTFNLRLTAEEQQARSSVPLPYHLSPARKAALLQGEGRGKIHYQPDTGDDFDEEDPDDDLDI